MTKRQTQAAALRLVAAEIEAGQKLPSDLARLLADFENDPTVQALVREDREDRRDIIRARKEFAAGHVVTQAQIKRES